MNSILRDLYNGAIIPWERREDLDEAYLKTVRKLEDAERYFTDKLSPDDCGQFQILERLHDDLARAGEESAFAYGFSLGLLLALDVMREAALFPGK